MEYNPSRIKREVSVIRKSLVHIGSLVTGFLFPPVCPVCESPMDTDAGCCPACQNALITHAAVRRWAGHESFHHINGKLHFESALTFWEYLPQVEKVIHFVKYEGRARLGFWMGNFISEKFLIEDPLFSFDLVIPIPLHTIRKRERGYNQSEMIVRGLDLFQRHAAEAVLERKHATVTQTALPAERRQENVAEAFIVRNRGAVEGKRILVVDDVITTGATLNSSAKALLSAGARSVYGLALARPSLTRG